MRKTEGGIRPAGPAGRITVEILMAVLLVLSLWMGRLTSLEFQGVEVAPEGGRFFPLEQFRFLKSDGKRIHVFKGFFNYHWYSQATVKIVPDDALLSVYINGMKVDPALFSQISTSGWEGGYDVNLIEYISLGLNEITLVTDDSGGGDYGAEIVNSFRDPTFLFWHLLALFSFILLLFRLPGLFSRRGPPAGFVSNLRRLTAEEPFLVSMLILGFILRVLYIFIFTSPQNYLTSDMGGYDGRACQLIRGEELAWPTYWSPFFHIFLSWLYRPLLLLGMIRYRVEIYIVLMAVFSVATNFALYKISLRLFSRNAARIVLTAATFWYPLVYVNIFILSENLFIPLMYTGLYVLACKKHDSWNAALLGLLWSVAFLARPIFIPFIPVFVIWMLCYRFGKKYILVFSAAVLSVALLMMSYNISSTHGREKSLSSGGGVNFALAWCDAKSIECRYGGLNFYFGPPAHINYPDSRKIATDVPFYNQSYYYRMGLTCIAREPLILLRNLRSVFRVFHSLMFPRFGNIYGGYELTQLFKFLNLVFLALSAVTIMRMRRGSLNTDGVCNRYAYLLALMFLSMLLAVYLQNPGEERYMIPYAPLLIMLGSPAVDALPNLIKRGISGLREESREDS